jgi:predicted nucleotidyltransferase
MNFNNYNFLSHLFIPFKFKNRKAYKCNNICTDVLKMLHKNKLKIMELFFEEPSKNFQIREISRLTKIAVTSVKKYLEDLQKERLVKKDKETLYPSYVANQQNRIFKIYKQQNMILKLYSSGLIDFLEDNLHPRCIILFGSIRKGEYNKKSDVDIFIQADQQNIKLEKFEKILKHKINLFFQENISKLSNELFNNIANGITLSGYLKIILPKLKNRKVYI